MPKPKGQKIAIFRGSTVGGIERKEEGGVTMRRGEKKREGEGEGNREGEGERERGRAREGEGKIYTRDMNGKEEGGAVIYTPPPALSRDEGNKKKLRGGSDSLSLLWKSVSLPT